MVMQAALLRCNRITMRSPNQETALRACRHLTACAVEPWLVALRAAAWAVSQHGVHVCAVSQPSTCSPGHEALEKICQHNTAEARHVVATHTL
eukprot:356295-Chlamydomonas_euryale.AAC.18